MLQLRRQTIPLDGKQVSLVHDLQNSTIRSGFTSSGPSAIYQAPVARPERRITVSCGWSPTRRINWTALTGRVSSLPDTGSTIALTFVFSARPVPSFTRYLPDDRQIEEHPVLAPARHRSTAYADIPRPHSGYLLRDVLLARRDWVTLSLLFISTLGVHSDEVPVSLTLWYRRGWTGPRTYRQQFSRSVLGFYTARALGKPWWQGPVSSEVKKTWLTWTFLG
ncbi:hypothetical protein GGR56DRAFT_378543 [Xylariaceae sp. FL0804]|nr:hypothetical protein GGR56DRAFT_378543 [Xylariaceae sp. FL0804]